MQVSELLTISEAQFQDNTKNVQLRGKMLPCKQNDMPYLIWLPDLLEPAENFQKFFTRGANGVDQVRNVWLLDYRNQGLSDHHQSYDLNDMAEDIVRFMDQNKITMATIGGHGFGAKVAIAAATSHLD